MVGSPQVINCTVSTVSGVESSLVMISWVGPEGDSIISDYSVTIGSAGGPIINGGRVIISPTTSSSNTYTSSLQFTYLMEGDEGTYTCAVMILETSAVDSIEIILSSKSIV